MRRDAYDWGIVGAGPAGATLARLLAPHGRVLLLDRRALDRPHRPGEPGKCCGGLLAPDAQRAMAQFGLALPKEVFTTPQIFAVRAIDLETGLARFYQRFYLNLDREAFDRHLAGLAVEAGAEPAWEAEFLHYEDDVLSCRQHGELRRAACRRLIAADGAASRVRRQCDPASTRPAKSCYVAIQERYEATETDACFSAFFDRRLTDFYGWCIPKDGTMLLGAAFPPGAAAAAAFRLARERLEAHGLRLGRRLERSGALLRRPRRRRDIWLGEGPVFAVGEAAGWISPSSAEGFSYAFRSAALLAELFAGHADATAADYRRSCGGLYRNLFAKQLKIPVMYHPVLRRAIMKSAITALRVELYSTP